jgi:hypothetical protein
MVMQNFPKLRFSLILYTIISGFYLLDVFFDKNSYNTMGAVILLLLLAIVWAVGLLVAALWDKTNWRVYAWSLCWVALPLLGIWLNDLGIFKDRSGEVEVIELIEPQRK